MASSGNVLQPDPENRNTLPAFSPWDINFYIREFFLLIIDIVLLQKLSKSVEKSEFLLHFYIYKYFYFVFFFQLFAKLIFTFSVETYK